MSSLAHLFPSAPPSAAADDAVVREAEERLETLIGAPRAAASTVTTVDDTPALQRLVGARARAAGMAVGGAVTGPTRVRRAGNRRDVLSIVSVSLALVAVVVAGVVAWNAITTSTPEKDALRTLSQTEAVLASEIQAVEASIERANAARANGIAQAQQFAAPLEQVAGATDEAAQAAAEKARAGYLAALETVNVPSGVEAYEPANVDPESLESIGAAIDAATVASDGVDETASQLAAVTEELAELDRDFRAAMAAFAATVPGAALAVVEENPAAEQSFRDAVTATADAVAASELVDASAAATLSDYAIAVEALRADQVRGEIAIAEQLAREEEERRLAEEQESGTTDPEEPVDPPAEPVDPGTEG
jgi:hypothetical protein